MRRVASFPALGVALALAFLAACGDGGTTPPPPATLAPGARAYLERALDTMQRHSVRRREVDWPTLRAEAIVAAGAAQSSAGTYDAIRGALRALGDNHSQFYAPGTLPQLRGERYAAVLPPGSAGQASLSPSQLRPSGRVLDGRIGYVFVPAFSGTLPSRIVARADSTLDVVRRLDGEVTGGACGWVVDLRANQGGNMWAMLPGVGPLLGDGLAGAFVDADGVRIDWWHRAGAAGTSRGSQSFEASRVTAPYTLRRATPPVAVLFGPWTASSGEATLISFLGMPNVRTFGAPSWGVSTGNQFFPLSDGAILNLTTTVMGDRTGRLYGAKVAPDVVTQTFLPDPAVSTVDAAMEEAVGWVAGQGACRE